MEIRELYIKNFGKFTDKHFIIDKGIHIFYGENEYGKSTVYAFIKAMLFGMERGRGRAALNDEFSRYEPWENPNYYAGTMRFTSGGKWFRLERQFDKYAKKVSLVCEDDGEQLSVEDGDLKMLLGGMTAESFENTVAVGQMAAKPGMGLAGELKNYAANFYETGSSVVDLEGTLNTLAQRKKQAEREIKILTDEQKTKKEKVRQESQYVSEDMEKLHLELLYNQEKLNNLQRGCHLKEDISYEKKLSADRGNNHTWKSLMAAGAGGIILAGIAGVGYTLISADMPIVGKAAFILTWLFLIVGAVLLGGGALQYFRIRSQTQRNVSAFGIYGKFVRGRSRRIERQSEEKQNRAANIPRETEQPADEGRDKSIQKIEWENQRIRGEWKEKQVRYLNLQEQLEEIGTPDGKIKSLQKSIQALEIAREKLIETSRNMTQNFGNILNKRMSEILSQITEGKYTKFLVDEKLSIYLYSDGRSIPANRLSRGTIEQIYLGLRLAVSDLLYEEKVPLILDDTFVFYDEKRLKSTLKWLSEQQRQVIIFTCQKREQEIIKQF